MNRTSWLQSAASFAWHASGVPSFYEGGWQMFHGYQSGSWSEGAWGAGRVALGVAPMALGAGSVAAHAAVRIVGGLGAAALNVRAASTTLTTDLREAATNMRNRARYVMAGSPAHTPQDLDRLSLSGLSPTVAAELQTKTPHWTGWATGIGAKSTYASDKIRVTASPLPTNRPGATPSFVGIGLDERIAARTLGSAADWNHHQPNMPEALESFQGRSRTAELVWATGDPMQPLAGHTPSIKHAAIPGTTGAITAQHRTRDTTRDKAVQTTLSDETNPNLRHDTAVMASLATIKYMSSPDTELAAAQPKVAALPTPRFAALTGANDLRVAAHYSDMIDHVQEARERAKWETGSVMRNDNRLRTLVPPVMESYLHAHGNDPIRAMNAFRQDLHHGTFAPSVNAAPQSATDDLTTDSLHQMVINRRRALSPARWLPPVEPPNSRGH